MEEKHLRRVPQSADKGGGAPVDSRPMISLVTPAYNEAAIVQKNLATICRYMETLEKEYRWELIFVNDGSQDETGRLAEKFAETRPNMTVLNQPRNFGIGQAFKTAFQHCNGDYVVTLDLDLSYSPEHIGGMVARMRETGSKIIVASPYMKGGKISHVPWLRRMMSVWANRFLSTTAKGHLSTLTGMVRAYDREFLKSVNPKSLGMDVNPEMIHKAMLLSARIDEVPAHLDWALQNSEGPRRQSSMKVFRHMMSVLLSGFLFRPVIFFILPGLLLLVFATYVNVWMFIHFLEDYGKLTQYTWFFDRASYAVAAAYAEFPHTFIVGGLSSMLAIQLISLGILSLQSKSYFEEIFYLGSAMFKRVRENERTIDE
jgi:glycosyltransferase involved in cell wall biosynthesis